MVVRAINLRGPVGRKAAQTAAAKLKQIVDANGHLQNTFPFGGDISDMIVTEILKAATVTNQTLISKP